MQCLEFEGHNHMEAYSKLGMIDGRCAHCYNTSVAVIGDVFNFHSQNSI